MHGVLSQHEHSLLLLSARVHGVLCVPPDGGRPTRTGSVSFLQVCAVCSAGE